MPALLREPGLDCRDGLPDCGPAMLIPIPWPLLSEDEVDAVGQAWN
jgi:hypothetical protein